MPAIVSAKRLADAADRFVDVRARVERRQPEVALACRAKPRTGRADDLRLLEQAVEELPRRQPARRAEPDVGRVDATEDRETRRGQAFAQQARVLHVERDL